MLTPRLTTLIGTLPLASLLLPSAASADPLVIAEQTFNSLSSASAATFDRLPDGGELTNAGSRNVGGPGLDFATFWYDTRGEGSGPVTPSSDTSDFIGVNSFAGSGAPNVGPDGTPVASGSEHNFQFNDTDGRVELVFEAVDVSAFSDRSLLFNYWIADTGYESDDTLFVTVSDGLVSETFLNFGEADLEGSASADDGSANWKTAFIDLETLIDSGFGTTLTVSISVDTNASSENVFVDNVAIMSGAEDPNGEEEPAPYVPIFVIQGKTHFSAYEGAVVRTSGIVTAVDSNGFYLQDPVGDGDDATSDALLVFTSSAPGVAVGDAVEIEGAVDEFTPGGASTGNLSTTEIVFPLITVTSSGNPLPAPVVIGSGGRIPPTESIDDNPFPDYDPATDGIDFFESLEAMLVTAQNAVAISGTNGFGEIYAVVDGGAQASGLSARGTLNISPDDFNPERVQIDPDSGVLPGFDAPLVDVGAALGNVTGVVSYNFGNFEIVPTQPFTPIPSALQPEITELKSKKQRLAVATYNVLNLDPNDDDGDRDGVEHTCFHDLPGVGAARGHRADRQHGRDVADHVPPRGRQRRHERDGSAAPGVLHRQTGHHQQCEPPAPDELAQQRDRDERPGRQCRRGERTTAGQHDGSHAAQPGGHGDEVEHAAGVEPARADQERGPACCPDDAVLRVGHHGDRPRQR